MIDSVVMPLLDDQASRADLRNNQAESSHAPNHTDVNTQVK